MTKAQTIWMALLVLSACCIAMAEQPVVWYPAQQAPDSQSAQTAPAPAGQQPTAQSDQSTGPQPAQPPTVQPGPQPTAQPGEAAPPGTTAGNAGDPRVDQPMQPLDAAVPVAQSEQQGGAQQVPVLIPDRTPLNTPQDLTLGGGAGGGRSYFQPSLRVVQMVNSSSGSTTNSSTVPVTLLSGTATLTQNWSRSHLMLDYVAGGTLFPTQSDLTSWFQQLGASMGFAVGRWDFSITDQGNYLPESAFGYYGLGMTSGFGGTGGLGPGYVPNQSILTPAAARISNTATTTMAYQLSPRSNIHFSGSFGILRFQTGGFSNTTDGTYSAGYDRSFGANTLGISYLGSLYYYGGTDRSIQTNGVSLAYGRRIAGRLALQIAGGGQIRQLDDPVQGSDTQPTWNMRGSLAYQAGRWNISTSLSRDTGSGAGVFGGTETFIWQTAVARPLGRVWSGSANFGIARNTALAVAPSPERIVNSQFVGLQISRPFNRETYVYFSYYFQHQTSNTQICVGCSDSFNRHVGGIGIEWQGRPRALGSL